MAAHDDTRIDNVIETTRSKPIPPRLSVHTSKLITTGVDIETDTPTDDDLTYMHSIMCQVGFPRKAVFGDEFERVCGNAALGIDAGRLWNGKAFVRQPIPFGPWPRLIMAYLNTAALRSQSPDIEVGASASEFIRMLGKQHGGGPRGGYTSFRKQMLALSACQLTLGFTLGDKAITYNGSPVYRFEAWLSNTGHQRTLWPGAITLSQEYFDTLKQHAVPLDLRALNALSGSALAMDAYAMLSQRLRRIEGRPVKLHWKNLQAQFGQDYTGKNAAKDFKRTFKIALQQALVVYPQAKVKLVTGGVLLMASPPPIPEKL